MEKIESFKVNHLTLKPGLYVSRKDKKDGVVVTTFDLRFTTPNVEPCLNTAPMHTIEHIAATYLRNCSQKQDVVYFGPMGCRTGFYLVMFGDLTSNDVLPLVQQTMQFIADFQGEIPGATPEECGNWQDQNLQVAKWHAARYLQQLQTNPILPYAEEQQ